MDDIYYDKYIKYKTKYLNKKNQIGGDIQEFKNLFNSYFLDNWVLTGSEAIKLYLIHFKMRAPVKRSQKVPNLKLLLLRSVSAIHFLN